MLIRKDNSTRGKISIRSAEKMQQNRSEPRLQVFMACICVSVMCVSVFSGVIVNTAYGAGGDTDCPGNGNGGHNHDESVPCPGNDTGCTNQPDPDLVEDIDEWDHLPQFELSSDLKIDGPVLICAGDTVNYAFSRPDQTGPLNHGVQDNDTQVFGQIITSYKLDEDCDSVVDEVVDNTDSELAGDLTTHTWSVSGGGTITKDAEGYGVFEAPVAGGNVTIVATIDDLGTGDRDDQARTLSLPVKVVGVQSLVFDDGTAVGPASGPDGDGDGNPDYEIDGVWIVPVESNGTFNAVLTSTPSLNDAEWGQISGSGGCWSFEGYLSDANGSQGASAGTKDGYTIINFSQTSPTSYLAAAGPESGSPNAAVKRVLAHVVAVDLTADIDGDGTRDNATPGDDDELYEDSDGLRLFASATAPSATTPDLNASARIWGSWSLASADGTIQIAPKSSASLLQLWKKNAGGTWTKLTWPYTISGDQTVPELWVEGLSVGQDQLELTYRHNSTATTIKDLVNFSVASIKVDWVATNSSLTDNPNAGGGKRVYPDKQSPTDTADRSVVNVKATIYPAQSGQTIYFKAIDVDDPSSSTTPIDDETLAQDNRGNPKTGLLSVPPNATTNSSGVAIVAFRVTMQPGDNFRVAASPNQAFLNGLIAEQSVGDGRVVDGAGSTIAGNYVTPMLTVWRRLWIEQDKMDTPPVTDQYYGSGASTIDVVTAGSPAAHQTQIDLGVNLPDYWSDEDMYEEGEIIISGLPAGQNTYQVFSNTANLLFDDTVIVHGAVPAAAVGNTFKLYDDDDYGVIDYPHAGAIGDREYGRAYITLVYLEGYSDIVTFHRYLTETEVMTGFQWNNGRDLNSTPTFWHQLVVGCFQPAEEKDGDSDSWRNMPPSPVLPGPTNAEPALDGQTVVKDGLTGDSASAIFMEACRDSAVSGNNVIADYTNRIVTHEIVHARGGNSLHNHGGLMSVGATGNSFTDETLALIRTPTEW